MQTAVEWLQDQYMDRYHISEEMKEIFKQALDFEAEQIREAFDIGRGSDDDEASENYYRQKFSRWTSTNKP